MALSRKVVSVVAASVLAVHVVAGCCSHHDHAHSSAAVAIASPHSHCDHDPHDACHHESEPTSPDHQDDPCPHSCEGSCSFLAASKILVSDLAPATGVISAVAADLLNLAAPSTMVNDRFGERAIIPPLRSHLSKCVLLV